MTQHDTEPAQNLFSPKHWNTFYLLSALSTLVISLTVALQPLFLDEVLKIPFENEGNINAHVQVVTQIISLGITFFLGQSWSRQHVTNPLLYGFWLASLGALLIPLSEGIELLFGVGSLLFYYLMRILITAGSDTVQMNLSTLGGDATWQRKESPLLANMTVMMAFGATVVCAILMQIPISSSNIHLIMMMPFLAALLGAVVTQRHMPGHISSQIRSTTPLDTAWELITSDPRLQLCFASAFYVRADMVVTSLFLSLWCISFADIVGVTRIQAVGQAGLLLGYMGVVVLLAMPLWTRFMQHHSRISAIGAGLSLAGFGFILMGWMDGNPYDWSTMLLPLFLVGIGQAGCLVAPKILATELSPKHILGSVQGILILVSGMGIVMLVQSGGYYFDAVGPKSPFVLMGTGHLLVMLYAFWLLKNGMDESDDHVLTKKRRKTSLKPLIAMISMLPIIWLVGRMLIGGISLGSSLGQMPVGFINRYLGDWAFNFLIVSLAIRPIHELTRIKVLMQYTRMIGLYAAFYAFLHVLTYFSLEWVFNWSGIYGDIVKRPFILLGMVAFLMLVVLTVTSTHNMVRKLGHKKWKKIHSLVYGINILVAFHFWFAATHENGEPIVYVIVVLLLLGFRLKEKSKSGKGAAPPPGAPSRPTT
ncbi:MAG: MFS transporter [Magnetococcales bacterium]|nr:MFS transporter [Magnetococcales bacterium]